MTTSDTRQPRRPLDRMRVTSVLADHGLQGGVRLLDVCGSTNAEARDLPAEATAAQGWAVVATEEQTGGRGRLGRTWSSPRGSGLLFSVLLDVPSEQTAAHVAMAPLFAGVGVVEVCRRLGVGAGLKWPNDVLMDIPAAQEDAAAASEVKVAGILAERSARGLIVGVGINIDLADDERPVDTAGSLRMAGVEADRSVLLGDLVAAIIEQCRILQRAPDPGAWAEALGAYRAVCRTIGRRIQVHLPDGRTLSGIAEDVDSAGHLLVDTGAGVVRLTAGDVVHLRPGG